VITVNNAFGREVRLRRLFRHGGGRLFVVPLDHSVSDGPITRKSRGVNHLVAQLASNGVDAVVLHKGSIRHIDDRWFTRTSLIVHLSASTMHAPDPDAKYLVGSVEEALRIGADAVSVHVNLGSTEEAQQVRDLGVVSDACDRWNVPLLVMIYPRGPRIENPRDPELVAHAATLAADLGADIVKTPYTGSVDEMADVVRACPIPIIVAGGPRLAGTASVLSYVDEVVEAGVSGLAMGRNVFQAPDPGGLARRIADRLHRTHDLSLRGSDRLEVASG
jgi:2-amino-4,5-dihydroxy-6-oxo-7-(phosphonooxy)heptanoate synthase